MIHGVKVKQLRAIFDGRGFLMEILRSDDQIFERFGQVYMTACKKGAAKAWHYHKMQTDNFTCVWGEALVVLYDDRYGSPTRGTVEEFVLKAPTSPDSSPFLLHIPPLVVHGFTALKGDEARILNIPTLPYRYNDPDEYRFPWDSELIPYRWPSEVERGE